MRPLHISKKEAIRLVGIIQRGSVHSGVMVLRSLGATLAYKPKNIPKGPVYYWVCVESELKRQRLMEN